jgi:predicted DNA repair protein MutK
LAGSSLFALIDDIASLLDDVSVLTKIAAKKTAGVLGDDLALNAEQVSGVLAQRELPVVWAVAKGSLLNKAILVSVALAISRLAPWAVGPLLMIGGAFLCYEGCEKLAHQLLHSASEADAALQLAAAHAAAVADAQSEGREREREQIKGAIRTDFVLSAEIIAITLGQVAHADIGTQTLVLVGIGVLMTVGVYGVVAAIVKLDDVGLYLTRLRGGALIVRFARGLGLSILRAAPYLMKALSIAGTIAVFLVGGGILTHGIAPVHHAFDALGARLSSVPGAGPMLEWLVPSLLQMVFGLVVGFLVLGAVALVQKLRARKNSSKS